MISSARMATPGRSAFLGGLMLSLAIAGSAGAADLGAAGAGTSGLAGGDRAVGRVFIDVVERPLGAVLDYISRVGEVSIVTLDDSIRNMRVTLRVENVQWRDALDVIAMKYSLEINESRIRGRILMLDRPKPITMEFTDADVRNVITAIAKQAGANVVIGETVSGRVTLHLDGVPWRDSLEIVARAARCVVVPERRNVIRIARPQELEAQMETRVFQLSYLVAEGSRYRARIRSEFAERVEIRDGKGQMSLSDVLQTVKSEKGSVASLRGTNSLVVTDTAQKLEVMERLINQLDRAPKQVHLSIKLIELSDADAEEVGILWQNGLTASASGMSFSTMFPFSPGASSDAFAGTFPGDVGVFTPGGGRPQAIGNPALGMSQAGSYSLGTLDFTALNALLRFIRVKTTGRVIQAPQLIALDHEEATIHVGELVRYAESFVSSTDGGGQASGFREASGSPVNLGIQVLVIPHVTGPDNNVMLTVVPKTETPKSAQLFEVFEGGPLGQLKLPQTVQRTVVTKMMLRDRETGIIAGLRQQSFGETVTRIPVLGDLPLIGWLFRHRARPAETNKNTNLLILITPTVIDFEKRTDIGDMVKRAEDELGTGFSLDRETAPQLLQPGF